MINNNWIKYTDRTFSSIKDSILTKLNTSVPELTDYSPSNLLIVIVDMVAGVSELINYYIDTTARELYLPTARRLSSVLKIGESVGYLGKARTPSYCLVEFSLGGDQAPSDFEIPAGTVLSTGSTSWVLVRAVHFRKGFYKAFGTASQYTLVTNYAIGVSDGTASQVFKLPQNYAHNSLDVLVGGVAWGRTDSLGFSSPTSKDFVVKLMSDGFMYLTFGDGVNGAIPANAANIVCTYKSTKGTAGAIGPNTLSSISSPVGSVPAGLTLEVTNPSQSFGAKEIEGIQDLRRSIPTSIRTLERAVTRRDYIDVAMSAPGVRSAVLNFDCGLGVTLYIVPEGGGVPTAEFLTEVQGYVAGKSIVSIPVIAKPSGETRVRLNLRVTGRYRVSRSVVELKTKQILERLYQPDSTKINQAIRKSDIYAAVDNLPEVDFLTITSMYAIPYLRPSNVALNLEASVEVLPNSSTEINWKLVYIASGTSFTVLRNGSTVATGLGVGSHANVGGLINLNIDALPAASNGDYWEFKTYPYNADIELTDYTVPVINPLDIAVEAIEQYV